MGLSLLLLMMGRHDDVCHRRPQVVPVIEASDNLQRIWAQIKARPGHLIAQKEVLKNLNLQRQRVIVDSVAKRRRGVKKAPYVRKRTEFEAYNPTKFTTDRACCSKQCNMLWTDREDEIEAFRQDLTPGMKPKQKRGVYFKHQKTLGQGEPCCHEWLKCVFGIRSNDKLYGRQKATVTSDDKRISVLTWFHNLLMTADKMPDSEDYIIPACSKKQVYQWYLADQECRQT